MQAEDHNREGRTARKRNESADTRASSKAAAYGRSVRQMANIWRKPPGRVGRCGADVRFEGWAVEAGASASCGQLRAKTRARRRAAQSYAASDTRGQSNRDFSP
jgi:hypothetical protein